MKKLPVAAESHSYIVMEEIKETLVLAMVYRPRAATFVNCVRQVGSCLEFD
jgi:hypothetical protein